MYLLSVLIVPDEDHKIEDLKFFYSRAMERLNKNLAGYRMYGAQYSLDQLLKLLVQYKENYGKCQSFRIESENVV